MSKMLIVCLGSMLFFKSHLVCNENTTTQDPHSTTLVENQKYIPFHVDKDLEKNPNSTAKTCLQKFLQMGGILQSIPDLTAVTEPQVHLHVGDAVYPVCTGGSYRSQTLWAILKPLSDRILLFPPHAARVGWDPYTGVIKKTQSSGTSYDAFAEYFGCEKAVRFGNENTPEWRKIQASPTAEGIRRITEYYDTHYFGPESRWQNNQGKRRIYIAFSHNAHVVLYRLLQTNDSLKNVVVIAIESDDLVCHPPAFLNTAPRSLQAYDYFANLLIPLFDLTE